MGKVIRQISFNFKEVFSNWKFLLFAILVFSLFFSLFNYFTNVELIKGNLGTIYYYSTFVLQFFIASLFAIFLPISFYKYFKFNTFSIKENSTSAIGTFIGVLVAGCPACSITFASYIGLAGGLALLPLHGLELKILSVPLLLYANYSILKDLQVCKIKKKR